MSILIIFYFEHNRQKRQIENLKIVVILLIKPYLYIHIKPKLLKLPQFSTSPLFKKKKTKILIFFSKTR